MADPTSPVLAPDLLAQQQQIQRQQALAQALLEGGNRDLGQTRMAGRVAIQNSPVEGLASLFSSYLGNKMQKRADASMADLSSRRNMAMAEALRQGFGQAQTDPSAAITTLASNPDTARYAAALAPELFKPKKEEPSQIPQMFGKYSPESIAAYQKSGNYADLRPMAETLTPYQQEELALRRQDLQTRKEATQTTKDAGKIPSGYRTTAEGNLEAIPGGPADAKAQAAANMKATGATDVDLAIGTLRDAYDRLEKGGGITSTEKGPLANIGAALSSSGAGQAVGKALGTQNQSARNDIAMTRPALLASLMKATGMSAKQMDSNAELKLWLATATDPTLDVESNRRALDNIEKKYLNPGNRVDQAPQASKGRYSIGQIIEQGGKKYRVTGGYLNDPDVEEVK